MVESKREIDDKVERETRFYITSLVMLANQLGPVIRSHWAVENSLHWVMDMIFRDDECRIRTDHAPANFTTIKHMAHNLIRRAPGKDASASSAKSQLGTTTSSQASSPHDLFTRFPWRQSPIHRQPQTATVGRRSRTQCTIWVTDIAPDLRATSRPSRNKIIVGSLECQAETTACWASELSLISRTSGSSSRAAAS